MGRLGALICICVFILGGYHAWFGDGILVEILLFWGSFFIWPIFGFLYHDKKPESTLALSKTFRITFSIALILSAFEFATLVAGDTTNDYNWYLCVIFLSFLLSLYSYFAALLICYKSTKHLAPRTQS